MRGKRHAAISSISGTGRAIISVMVGLLAGTFTVLLPHPIHYQGIGVGDIGPPLIGFARFLRGESPFNLSTDFGPLAAYPFTTSLVLAPFLLIPLSWVVPIFCSLSCALLSYALLQNGEFWRLLVIASMPCVSALHSVQWSPLITASFLLPGLLPLVVVKPQLGIVSLAAARWTWRITCLTCAIALLSLIIYPSWPLDWVRSGALWSYAGRIPLMIGPGIFLLLAGLFWRNPSARLLLALALIPQRIWYDQLPLLLVANSWKTLLILVGFSWITAAVTPNWGNLISRGEQDPNAWMAVVCLFYLPTLGVLLWQERRYLVTLARR